MQLAGNLYSITNTQSNYEYSHVSGFAPQPSSTRSSSFPSGLTPTQIPVQSSSFQSSSFQSSSFPPIPDFPQQDIPVGLQSTNKLAKIRAAYITKVPAIGDKSKNEPFTMYLPNSQKTYNLVYSGFLPLKKGDIIRGVCQLIDPNTLALLQPPIVVPPRDKDSVIGCFFSAFYNDKLSKGTMFKLYQRLCEMVDSKVYTLPIIDGINIYKDTLYVRDVCELLDCMASRWSKDMGDNITEQFASSLVEFKDKDSKASLARAAKLLNWWTNNRTMRQLYLLGFTKKFIGDKSREAGLSKAQFYAKLVNNPYTVPQVDMKTCEIIDQRTGRIREENDIICGNIIRDVWKRYNSYGSMCTALKRLERAFPDILAYKDILIKDYGLVFDDVKLAPVSKRNEQLKNEVDDDKKEVEEKEEVEEVRIKQEVYLNYAYRAEVSVSNFIAARMKPVGSVLNGITTGPVIQLPEPVIGLDELDHDQIEAMKMVGHGGISVITGYAGTGKTTTLDKVFDYLTMNGVETMLCSFTGKAVSRLKQVIPKCEPATMHRMIASPSRFPNFKCLIIDEASMITTGLFYEFINVFGTNFSLVLVGDSGQLPPIGPGSMFNDILLSRTVKKSVLKTCHRTHFEDGSVDGILLNCNRIARWPDGETYTPHYTDNFNMDNNGLDKIFGMIQSLHRGGVSQTDFAIISPYNAYLDKFNLMCQAIYNGEKMFTVDPKGKKWHVNDRVRMRVNNYDHDVMNGEEGIILSVHLDKIIVDFGICVNPSKDSDKKEGESRIVEIPFVASKTTYMKEDREDDDGKTQLTVDSIILSWAITGHGSQGSEYIYVIFVLPDHPQNDKPGFINRNLIYTCLSRARRVCYVLGDIVNVCNAVGRGLPYRAEHLLDRLRELLPIINEEDQRAELDVFDDDEDIPDSAFDNWDY